MAKKVLKVLVALAVTLTLFFTVQSTPASAAQTFIKPVEGTYSSGFGMRNGRMHWGVDIAGNSGKTIKASAAGTVVTSTTHSSYGEYIVIRHNIGGKTYDTLYAHMVSGSRKVAVGNTVSQGQAIGIVGSTGNSTGPHLHFELHTGPWNGSFTNAVDPKPYIEGQINPETPHAYDGTWARVVIKNPNGGSTANLFGNVGYGIIGTLPVGNGYKVYGQREYAANGDMYYDVGPGYIHSAYGELINHHARVSTSISTYKSPNGAFNRTLTAGTYKVHAAKDGWYDLGANTWVKANQVVVIKQ